MTIHTDNAMVYTQKKGSRRFQKEPAGALVIVTLEKARFSAYCWFPSNETRASVPSRLPLMAPVPCVAGFLVGPVPPVTM